MTTPLRIVALSGSLHAPSKTEALLAAILAELDATADVDAQLIRLHELAPGFAGALRRDQVGEEVEQALQQVAAADLLIVATPIYKASYTGLLKYFLDFLDQYALVDVPVLLAATGGSDRHALVIDHALRPLFAFFQAQVLPVGIYGKDADFAEGRLAETAVLERIQQAAVRALPLARARQSAALPAEVA